jgi:NYN domain
MKDFEEWAKSIPKWAGTLLDLGASWDTFRREPDEVISDLVQGGIPLLSAKDIVDKARQVLQRKSAPLGVFWDLDTIGIPRGTNGRDVIARLKQELSSWGQVAQLRGYASNTLSLIPEQYRSDMIESGFVLIDSPHGGKEVATKRMIIDAMVFAYESGTTAASLCIISADPDIAHLLTALERTKWSTIFVSNHVTLKRMTDTACDLKLQWETDILQLQPQYDEWNERGTGGGAPSLRAGTGASPDDWRGGGRPVDRDRDRYPRDGGRYSPTDDVPYGNTKGGNIEPYDDQVRAVVAVMEMLLESDELYVAEPVLRFQLVVREGGNTADRQNYNVWIEKAIRAGALLLFNRPGVPKGRFYCMPSQLENSRAACSQQEINSFEEEKLILNLINDNPTGDRWVTRIQVIDALRANFPRMKSPANRVKVFQNGARKGLFFVAKDGPTQVVARTKDEAQSALNVTKSRKGGYDASSNNNKRRRNPNNDTNNDDSPYERRSSGVDTADRDADDDFNRDEKRHRDDNDEYRRPDEE